MFQLSRTFAKPSASQSGQPSPGAGAQTTGDYFAPPAPTAWSPSRPTQGRRTFFNPSGNAGAQRGTPQPYNNGQRRPAGSMPNVVPYSGLPTWGPVMKQDYGAAGFAPQYGKVLTNPIGAGVVNRYRPQAFYGPAAQYDNGAIWWTSQVIPTTVNLTGLTDPQALAALLGPITVQAVYPVA